MNILLGVSGSISAYKTFDLIRGLIKNGHKVKVILTSGATKFVVPNLYTYLGAEDVYLNEDDFKHKNVLHIDLVRWCDLFVIAPISANTISRLARGEASDLLSSVFLAMPDNKSIAIFPAMNTHMLHHPFTKENIEQIKKIKSLNNVFISPTDSGVLACNDVGEGKLPSVEELTELIPLLKSFNNDHGKKVLITTGATIVPLDPVRFLTNSSSGITGFELAKTYLINGYDVHVIAGMEATSKLDLLTKHPRYKLTRVKTVSEMKDSVLENIKDADTYISSAAISDFEFNIADEKIKKDLLKESLPIKPAPDILKAVIDLNLKNLKIVGFAAETNLSLEVLLKKYHSKPVTLLVGTKVHNGLNNNNKIQGFNQNFADYKIMKNGIISFEGTLTKEEMTQKIIEMV